MRIRSTSLTLGEILLKDLHIHFDISILYVNGVKIVQHKKNSTDISYPISQFHAIHRIGPYREYPNCFYRKSFYCSCYFTQGLISYMYFVAELRRWRSSYTLSCQHWFKEVSKLQEYLYILDVAFFVNFPVAIFEFFFVGMPVISTFFYKILVILVND